LNCTSDYVTKLCREGKLEGVRIRNVWYVKESSIAKFQEERELTKVARSEELAEQRRKEQEEFSKQTATPAERLVKRFTKTGNHYATVALVVLVLFVGVASAAFLPSVAQIFSRFDSEKNLGALGKIQSPFFGVEPTHVPLNVKSFIAKFFGDTAPSVAQQITATT
jgi:hypothetical protein